MNDEVLLELGLSPLQILAKKRAVKTWVRMATNTNCSIILHEAYLLSRGKRLQWTTSMKNMLYEIGLMQCFEAHIKAFKIFQDIYHQTTLDEVKSGDSKLRAYALFKTSPGV